MKKYENKSSLKVLTCKFCNLFETNKINVEYYFFNINDEE
jgi:hypothetical protein